MTAKCPLLTGKMGSKDAFIFNRQAAVITAFHRYRVSGRVTHQRCFCKS
jgi:hypothetical protein